MSRYLLDTNHASPLVTKHHPLRRRFFSALQAGHEFSVCVQVYSEVWYGLSSVPRREENRAEWQKLARWLPCYVADKSDAENAAELRLSLRSRGRQLALADALLATIALRYDLILLPSDRDFSPVQNLRQENWL
jgi:tRNA(fMet)-specific endonuclease VapC